MKFEMRHYVRKYATDAERHEARSENARRSTAKRMANGNNRGGRPRGTKNRFSIDPADCEVFRKLADAYGMPFNAFMHDMAERMKLKRPDLF